MTKARTPVLNTEGLLPKGVHGMSIDDIGSIFGTFTTSDRRQKLFSNLRDYWRELSKVDCLDHIIVNGSFVTNKDNPNDVDLIVVLKNGTVPSEHWSAWQTWLVTRRWVKRRYGIEILVARKDNVEYDKYLAFFSQVKGMPHLQKGVVLLSA